MKKTLCSRHFLAAALIVLAAMWGLPLALPSLSLADAISAPNGKVEGVYGNMDGDHTKVVSGSASLPLGAMMGTQFDAIYGEIGSTDQIKGLGLHLFTRDPQSHLLGLAVSYVDYDGTQFERYALEGEYYFGPFTAEALLGHQTGDIDDAAYGILDLAWYPADNLRLVIGGTFADSDQTQGHIGVELQAAGGLALFAEAAIGKKNYEHALMGLRYYFGNQKSLIKRHREDDPKNRLLIKLPQPVEPPSAPISLPEDSEA